MSESDRYFFARSFAITAMNKSCLIKPFPQSAQAARIFSRLRLFHGLLSVEPFLHCGHRADQHVAVLAELVHVGDRTVAGNDFRIGGNLPDDHVERLNQTADAAAVRLVDERERPCEVLVAHLHGVALSNQITESPSVCPIPGWMTRISSPLGQSEISCRGVRFASTRNWISSSLVLSFAQGSSACMRRRF